MLAAVCDIDPAKAEAAGRAFGVPHYTDAAAMLATRSSSTWSTSSRGTTRIARSPS